MTTDWINLVLKLVTLLFLSAASQAAFHKRLWATGTLCLAIWITIFRLALLRAIAVYAGVFGKESPYLVEKIRAYFQSAHTANATDLLILLGAIVVFYFISQQRYKLPK